MRPLLAGAFLLALALAPTAARAATRLYVIAIGNNEAPRESDSARVQPLLYADDDAAAMVSFAGQLAGHTSLLTVMDAETSRLYPELLGMAVPPTLVQLRRTIAWHKAQIETDRRAGDESVVLFFFSGHGRVPADQPPSLAMLDGPLTRAMLHDEILSSLPARYVHMVIDACHAEAVVRPRGDDLALTAVDPEEARAVLERNTLVRFPHVGVIVAAPRAKEAHEWDRLRHGVFTYELLSALRGGADVNRDGRVEYSEVFAFVTAANHGVDNPRAAVDVRVYPPPVNRRAPLVDLTAAARAPRLVSDGWGATSLRIEDDRGRSVATLHAESGIGFALALPSDRTLFFRLADGREAQVRPSPGERISSAALAWRKAQTRSRDALDRALDSGLFTTPFGPAYYRGFVDARPELVPVPLLQRSLPDSAPGPASSWRRIPPWYLFAGGGVLAVTTGLLTVAAVGARRDFDDAPFQRDGADALERLHLYRGLAIATGVAAAGAATLGVYLKLRVAPVVDGGTDGRPVGLALRGHW